jgi:curli biogenesis system outer membrane secretion channel CsgG
VAALVLLQSAACMYSFHGGGLPADLKTIAVLPFDNETPVADLQQQLLDLMRPSLDSRLGLRAASESQADVVVRGTIIRYDADIPIGYSASQNGAPVTASQRKLELAVDVDIVNQKTGKILWQRKSLVGSGTYQERAETDGRKIAMQQIVSDMIEGAQSQW